MSCNAHNHRPGCNCGWGGVFYGLGLGSNVSYWLRAESYTVPNARCPRCAALVYFYRSPYGGSVFFDDLGPPWPKHPCTASGERHIQSGKPVARTATTTQSADGWHPMQCQSIGELRGQSEIAVLLVGDGDGIRQLFATKPSAKISSDSPMLWRRLGKERGRYEISTLDLSHVGFKEVRFDIYSELEHLQKAVRANKPGTAKAKFDQRMATLKLEFLRIVPTKEFGAKVDALIQLYRQDLLNHGDLDQIERAASVALEKCLEREVIIKEKALNSVELHSALLEECVKICKEFFHLGVDLKLALRQERKRAISAGLSIEAGKASLRVMVEKVLAAELALQQRKLSKSLLETFLDELLANSEMFGGRARPLLESVIKKALLRDQHSVDLIKERLLVLARELLEDSAKRLALKQEKLREKRENESLRVLKNKIESAARHHPAVSVEALVAAVERIANRDSSIEDIQAATDEVARKFLVASQTAVLKSPNVKRKLQEPIAPARDHRQSANSLSSRRQIEPFNSAMAEKLGLALALAKKGK